MWQQVEFQLQPRRRGFHLVTGEVLRHLPPLPKVGVLPLFVKHTSAPLSITEHVDLDVLAALESIFNRMVKEREPYYLHTLEGDDDMPAHAKTVIVGESITVPITDGRLNLGTWQGIYLCEFRDYGGPRRLVATIAGSSISRYATPCALCINQKSGELSGNSPGLSSTRLGRAYAWQAR